MANRFVEGGLVKVSGLVLLLLAVLIVSSAADAAPNILLIVADDLGVQLPAYGDHTVETPNIDGIANAGAVFSNAFVTQSSCSPSRSSIHTGTYPHQNGQLGLWNWWSMSQPYPTIPSILKKEGGYRTGIIGKTHVKPLSAFTWDYKQLTLGWDQWRATRDVRRVADLARTFFDADVNTPFFLQVSFIDPHDWINQDHGIPEHLVMPGDITLNTYTGQPVPDAAKADFAAYYNCIQRLDVGIGMLLNELAASGAASNTLIIFVSDNGGGPVQGGKTDVYEKGLRVPMIIRYPGVGQPRVDRDHLVSTVDILPTILNAAGVPVPQPTQTMMTEGRSLLPLLTEAPPAWRTYLFAEMNFHYPKDNKPSRTVRDGQYKLIHSYPPLNRGVNGFMLFDLISDPYELNNLFASPDLAPVRDRLQQELSAWQTRTNDTFPH